MINKNIVIAALARDCEDSLKTNIPLIEALRTQFLWSQVVIVENDSKDSTKQLLTDWSRDYTDVVVFSSDLGIKTIPDKSDSIQNPMTSFQRIEKMASYRNVYLDHISKIDHPIDLVIVIDIDVLQISADGLIGAINTFEKNTGAVFANGISVKETIFGRSEIYYDVFAMYEYPQLKEFSYSPASLHRTFKSINRNVKKQRFYSVISAFGGVGIYNYEAIRNLRYQAVVNPLNRSEAICEHIPFNQQIVELGFKNYIARDFKVIYQKHELILLLKDMLPVSFFNAVHPLLLRLKGLFT